VNLMYVFGDGCGETANNMKREGMARYGVGNRQVGWSLTSKKDGEGAKGLNGNYYVNYLRVMSRGNSIQVSHHSMQVAPAQQCMRQCTDVIGSIKSRRRSSISSSSSLVV
jgi:hypothetical protein